MTMTYGTMLTMTTETKLIGAMVLTTVAIISGAVFFFSRTAPAPQNGPTVDPNVLVRPDSYRQGSDLPKAVLVEFADYQCPACESYHPIVKTLMADMGKDVQFVVRHFPLQQHQNAKPAAYAAEAAGKQGNYWGMHDLLYEKHDEWETAQNPKEMFGGYAQSIGLNAEAFLTDMDESAIRDKVERDAADGNTLGVNATPTFFLNGQKILSPRTADELKQLVADTIKDRPISQAPTQTVHIHTNIAVVLDGKRLDFTQIKYQSTAEKELDSAVHLHDGVGEVLHIHAPEIPLGRFFSSLGMTQADDCLTLDTKEQYCTNDTKKLQLYVNGKLTQSIAQYQPQDLDRILLRYGSQDQKTIDKELAAVADTACIYSEKCPERGTPPTEECVGGVGTDCEKQ